MAPLTSQLAAVPHRLPTNTDRRDAPRRLYAAWERVATSDAQCDGARIASYRCHDLARDGFSFWTASPPDDGHVVLSLAGETGSLVLAAEVRHATPVTCLAEPLYLVGCRFVD